MVPIKQLSSEEVAQERVLLVIGVPKSEQVFCIAMRIAGTIRNFGVVFTVYAKKLRGLISSHLKSDLCQCLPLRVTEELIPFHSKITQKKGQLLLFFIHFIVPPTFAVASFQKHQLHHPNHIYLWMVHRRRSPLRACRLRQRGGPMPECEKRQRP